jgi:hypothetical protein
MHHFTSVQQTMICRADFLDQRVGTVNPLPGEDQPGSQKLKNSSEKFIFNIFFY